MKQAGFVLIWVLFFTQVFSLISLYSITTATTVMKANNHLWHGMTFRLKSDAILQRLENNIKPTCIIPMIPATDLAKKDLVWWQLTTCHANVNGIQYYYFMESLGDDPCATIENSQENQVNIARYYRITLYLPEGHYMLQSTIALPVAQTSACTQKMHTVIPGRQGWREI